MKPYQVLMANAIKEAQKEPKGFDDLMAEIFEMFMQMEREMSPPLGGLQSVAFMDDR